MSIEKFIALRYLTTRRKPFFVSFLIYISVIGIALGVFSIVFILGIMKGFQRDFQSKILGFTSPLTVTFRQRLDPELTGKIKALPFVDNVYPMIEGEMVVKTQEGGVAGVRIRGIDPMTHPLFQRFDFFYGDEMDQRDLFSEKDELPGILVGEELASDLQVHPNFFDEVTLVFPLGDIGPTGEMVPSMRRFRVIGLFKTGFYEYDHKAVLIHYDEARKLFQDFIPPLLSVEMNDIYKADEVAQNIQSFLPPEIGEVKTWQEQNQKLFGALKLERMGMLILLSMIILLSAMTLFGLLSIVTTEKTKDMAILQAHGVTASKVLRIFLYKGGILGVLGAFLGILVAVILGVILYFYPIPLPPSYYVEFLPIELNVWHILSVAVMTHLVCLLAILYLSYRASKGSVIDLLRYE